MFDFRFNIIHVGGGMKFFADIFALVDFAVGGIFDFVFVHNKATAPLFLSFRAGNSIL